MHEHRANRSVCSTHAYTHTHTTRGVIMPAEGLKLFMRFWICRFSCSKTYFNSTHNYNSACGTAKLLPDNELKRINLKKFKNNNNDRRARVYAENPSGTRCSCVQTTAEQRLWN